MEINGSDDGRMLLVPLFGGFGSDAPEAMLYCSCAVAAHRFAGATEPDEPMVRIQMAEFRRFAEALRVLERDRRGEATLECSELWLSVRIYDRAGHVRLSARLTDYQIEGDHLVAVSFDVDPTALPGILRQVDRLLTFPHPDPSGEGPESLGGL